MIRCTVAVLHSLLNNVCWYHWKNIACNNYSNHSRSLYLDLYFYTWNNRMLQRWLTHRRCRYNYSTRYFLIRYRKCHRCSNGIPLLETRNCSEEYTHENLPLRVSVYQKRFFTPRHDGAFQILRELSVTNLTKFEQNPTLRKFPININFEIATWRVVIWSLRHYILSIIFAYNRMWLLFPEAGLRTCRLALIQQTQQSFVIACVNLMLTKRKYTERAYEHLVI